MNVCIRLKHQSKQKKLIDSIFWSNFSFSNPNTFYMWHIDKILLCDCFYYTYNVIILSLLKCIMISVALAASTCTTCLKYFLYKQVCDVYKYIHKVISNIAFFNWNIVAIVFSFWKNCLNSSWQCYCYRNWLYLLYKNLTNFVFDQCDTFSFYHYTCMLLI